jgi:hypothetical protein
MLIDPNLPLPRNPLHQRFADLVLRGMPAPEAYRKAGFKSAPGHSSESAASRMLKNVEVARYIQAVRAEVAARAADDTVGTVLEKRQFLARVWRTPLLSIDPTDPERKNGDLILKYKRIESEDGSAVEEIVKLDPLKAIAEDNRLAGDDPQANAIKDLAEALAALGGGGGLPTDRM